MVTGGSVDGLVSGMSTSSVISSLMQVEAAPQTALKKKVSTQQTVINSYMTINTKMSSLLSAAKAIGDPLAWKGTTATSSSDAAVVSTIAGSTSQSGSLTFRVKSLAAAQSWIYSDPAKAVAKPTDTVMTGTKLTFKVNGTDKDVAVTDTSLKGVVDAINKTPDLGIRATAIQIAPNKYTMQLTATTPGKDATFELPDASPLAALGAPQVAAEGSNAELAVGSPGHEFKVESDTNTFKGLLDGLTVTATKVQADTDPAVTVSVASDSEGIAGKIQAMVDAANQTLTEIGTQTKNKSGNVDGGALAGNTSMSTLATSVLSTVSGGAGALGSLKSVGIELTRDGRLSFNKTTFLAALQADPVKTQSYFISAADLDNDGVKDGIADKLISVADKATQSSTGTLSRLITSGNDAITDLNHRIDDWDVRLSARQETLQKQFTAMESALGKLKNQGNWLSGQISSLG